MWGDRPLRINESAGEAQARAKRERDSAKPQATAALLNKVPTLSFQKEKNKGRESSVQERVIPPCNSLKREADDESRSAATGLDSD
jgi:hypothetical protein